MQKSDEEQILSQIQRDYFLFFAWNIEITADYAILFYRLRNNLSSLLFIYVYMDGYNVPFYIK